MEQVPESSKPVRCKLCAAFVACHMPSIGEFDFPGSETFSRDPEICDACFAHDYSARGPISWEWWAAQALGCCFAIVVFVALGFLSLHPGFERFVPARRLDRIFVNFLISIVAGACFAIPVWLLLGLWMGRWPRTAVTETEESARAEAERFRWLARWAELTGHHGFRKRMLKQAAALDASREN